MSASLKIPSRMTVAEFFDWSAPDDFRWQLVDGEPVCMAPANRTHGTLQGELAWLIRSHLHAQSSPCALVIEPGVLPRALAGHNVRVPDLAVTCSPYETEEAALTDPVLLIEILSPRNEAKTWTNIWAYTTIPAVREILIVRSGSIGVELLRRNIDGSWPETPSTITEGCLSLESIGFVCDVAALYATTRHARPIS